MKKELLIYLGIIVFLTVTIHYKELMAHPIEHILNLPNSGAYGLTVGHKPGATEKGKTYTIKPTMVYNKGGKFHKAVITIKMKY